MSNNEMKFKVGDQVIITFDGETWEKSQRDYYLKNNKGTIVKINPKAMWYPYEVDIPSIDTDGTVVVGDTTIWREEELTKVEE